MTVDFITTEVLTDDQILRGFGETLCYGEGKFTENDFFESIGSSLDTYGSCMTESSKGEVIKQLKVLLTKLLEEAVEKVRYEEVDCYDSEQIYEVIDELDPVDNNGSPTREIYNDKDELMWHNAELVNRGEIITQGIRSISENLSLIMEGEPESFRGGDIAFSTARRVMEMLGWKCSYAGKATLGQDAYYCIICTKPDKDFKYKIFGNAYEGSISISKEKL